MILHFWMVLSIRQSNHPAPVVEVCDSVTGRIQTLQKHRSPLVKSGFVETIALINVIFFLGKMKEGFFC